MKNARASPRFCRGRTQDPQAQTVGQYQIPAAPVVHACHAKVSLRLAMVLLAIVLDIVYTSGHLKSASVTTSSSLLADSYVANPVIDKHHGNQ